MSVLIPSQLEEVKTPIKAGLISWIIITSVCFIHLTYLYHIDKLQKTKHARLCRSSKTISALRLAAALAILCVYVAGGNKQGFYCHEHGGDEPTCSEDGGSWVFPFRFIGYAVAGAATNYVMGLLVWSDTNSRFWLALFGASLWTISGVFGSLTGYENHHWWYFYLGLVSIVTVLTVFVFTRRRRGANISILLDIYLFLHIGALVIWVLSPTGYRDPVLDINVEHWFYLIFDIIAFAVIPMMVSVVHIPHRFAVEINRDHQLAYEKSADDAHIAYLHREQKKCLENPSRVVEISAAQKSNSTNFISTNDEDSEGTLW